MFLAIKVATALQFYLLIYTFSNLPAPEDLSLVPVVTVWTAFDPGVLADFSQVLNMNIINPQ